VDLANLSEDLTAVSTHYADRYNIDQSDDWLMLKLQEELGELTPAYLALTGRTRDRGRSASEARSQFEDELTDVIGHALLIAQRFEVDLDVAFSRKWLAYPSD